MSHLQDVADTYTKSRQRSWQESLREAQTEIENVHKDEHYYMCMPRDYIIKRGIRNLLIFMICILACHSVLTISTPPMFLYSFFKWRNYCQYCSYMNISTKKLNILLAVWFLICMIINIVFWCWIE